MAGRNSAVPLGGLSLPLRHESQRSATKNKMKLTVLLICWVFACAVVPARAVVVPTLCAPTTPNVPPLRLMQPASQRAVSYQPLPPYVHISNCYVCTRARFPPRGCGDTTTRPLTVALVSSVAGFLGAPGAGSKCFAGTHRRE